MRHPDTLEPRASTAALVAAAFKPERAYLCVRHESREAGLIRDRMLATFEERHRHQFPLPTFLPVTDIEAEVVTANAVGVVFVMAHGVPSRSLLRSAAALLAQQRSVFFYWPSEEAIERIQAAQLASYRRVWLLLVIYASLKAPGLMVRTIFWRHQHPIATVSERAVGVRQADEPSHPGACAPQLALETRIETGDSYKQEVQKQWNANPCGSHFVKSAPSHTLDWYLEVEQYRYGEYAPWMPQVMEFAQHAGNEVLEIGGGLGTDLAQFAKQGARVTDVDLSAGHLALAQENFRLRGLKGSFVHHDAEALPFADESFDVVYSNGVLHHTPHTQQAIREIRRVLKPGGRAIVMVYAQSSLFFWGRMVYGKGLKNGLLGHMSVGEVLSRHVEITEGKARPLVKVYTRQQARALFRDFNDCEILQRQLTRAELPGPLRWLPLGLAGRLMGWNLIIKATKGR